MIFMDRSVLEFVGEWIANTTLADIPEEGRRLAGRAVVDFVGVALAGGRSPIGEMLDRYCELAGGPPEATLIGRGRQSGVEQAALVNGVQGHALDFDDLSLTMGGHPTTVIFPAALAVAEAAGASGRELLQAYAVGFEVAATFGRAVDFVHTERGWHNTGTVGTFGSAAAAAKLLHLDAERTTTALGIAAAAAAGLKTSFGTTAKPIQVGRAAQNGVHAARFAAIGATANPAAFEGKHGFGEVFNGPGQYDPGYITEHLGATWNLVDPGLLLKQYPCCGSTHSAIDAALQVRERITDPDQIVGVTIWTHPRRRPWIDRPTVSTPLEAKFSLQYVVAAALRTGRIEIPHFTPEVYQRPDIQDLMARVDARPMPEERWGVDDLPAEVAAQLADGQVVSVRVERAHGDSREGKVTDDHIRAKFHSCCAVAGLTDATTSELYELLRGLERHDDLSPLSRLLGQPGRAAQDQR